MPFVKGQPRPPNAGRKKGSPKSQTRADIKAALAMHAPEMVAELVRLTRYAKNEMTRVAAIRECFDRVLGKATQPVEGQMLFGVSSELQRLLEQHDGRSRSIPVIEHRADDGYQPDFTAALKEEKNRPDGLSSLDRQNGDMQHDANGRSRSDLEPLSALQADEDVQETQ